MFQKFNAKYNWKAANIGELKNYLADRNSSREKLEFNAVINALRICDPAVGSGHFLVSALNEIILIKYELGLLVDDQGARLSDYEVTLENDELIVTDENGKIFEYNPLKRKLPHSKTMFHEKQTIIENCLFGVISIPTPSIFAVFGYGLNCSKTPTTKPWTLPSWKPCRISTLTSNAATL